MAFEHTCIKAINEVQGSRNVAHVTKKAITKEHAHLIFNSIYIKIYATDEYLDKLLVIDMQKYQS